MKTIDLSPDGLNAMKERYIAAVKSLVPLEGSYWPDGDFKDAECEDEKIRSAAAHQIQFVLGLRASLDELPYP